MDEPPLGLKEKISDGKDNSTNLLEEKTEEDELNAFFETLNKGTESIRFPKGATFCELLYSRFCKRNETRDKDCTHTKGCKIYQRYLAIKEYYPNDKEALEVLEESDIISYINRG